MGSIDSDDSNPNRFEIRVNDRAMVPLTRKRHDGDDEEVSDMEAKLIRRKRPRTTTALVVPKIKWTKTDELLILEGIVDYESETKLSYRSDWNAFYGYIKCFIQTNFSKLQLRSKVRKLKKRFIDNLAKSDNVDDDEVFKLSMTIWGKKIDKEIGSNHENLDQGKDVTDVEHDEQINENVEQQQANKDLTDVEHDELINVKNTEKKVVTDVEHDEQIIENVEQAKDVTDVEHDQINENVEQAKDVTGVEHDEQINENVGQAKNKEQAQASSLSAKVDNGEKEKKSERVGVEEFCVLQDAFEAILIPSLGKTHEKLLLRNLKNLEAEKGKELSDEWKALLVEEMQLRSKKLAFSTKLAAAAVVSV